MHVQSLFWFALALVAVAAFYRRFFAAFGGGAAPWAAGLATCYMRSMMRTAPRSAGWPIATRWSPSPRAMPVLLLHDRWRRAGLARRRLHRAAVRSRSRSAPASRRSPSSPTSFAYALCPR